MNHISGTARPGRGKTYSRPLDSGRLVDCPKQPYLAEGDDLKHDLGQLILPSLPENMLGWRRGISDPIGRCIDRIESARKPMGVAYYGADIVDFFGSVDHHHLSRQMYRLDDLHGSGKRLWLRVVPWLPPGGVGIPAGCPFSPVLALLYLSGIANRHPNAVFYADNFVVLSGPKMFSTAWREFRQIESELRDLGLTVHDRQPEPETFCKRPIEARQSPREGRNATKSKARVVEVRKLRHADSAPDATGDRGTPRGFPVP